MGGTASPLSWSLAYDPIVEGLSRALRVGTPTFVDDLAANTVGPAQTLAAQIFLIAASACAGLLVESHACRWISAAQLNDDVWPFLAAFPITISRSALVVEQ